MKTYFNIEFRNLQTKNQYFYDTVTLLTSTYKSYTIGFVGQIYNKICLFKKYFFKKLVKK